ncbi:NACHT domain-containing protein [Streptomyces yaizuensis]|uniref:NACHT domain-containing protein n=1 Tax=Streptomyces yaizuensis TaxID=2989713 RepID=A0ABQ5P5Q4_9ACTN|nr:NACHT domain-containing protein [Streptomyces sp. YSPA8]GLF97920.1 NACHT domain-containing protein [Streptomyces sp. YSPA8]
MDGGGTARAQLAELLRSLRPGSRQATAPRRAAELAAYESGERIPGPDAIRLYAYLPGADRDHLFELWERAVAEERLQEQQQEQERERDQDFARRYAAECAASHPLTGPDGPPAGYVHVGLRAIPDPSGHPEEPPKETAEEPAEELHERHRRVLLRGAPGSGKTTTLRHVLHRELARPGGRLPFLLPVRALLAGPRPPGAEDLLSACGSALAGEAPPGWTERILRAGGALLLVDGLDDAGETRREDLRPWLRSLLALHPGNRALLTARSSARHLDWPAEEGFAAYRLAPLDREGVRAFTEQWHRTGGPPGQRARRALDTVLETAPGIRRLASTPLLAAAFCTLSVNGEWVPPLHHTAFLRAALTRLATGEPDTHDPGEPLGSRETVDLAQSLAVWLQRNALTEATREQAVRQFERALPPSALLDVNAEFRLYRLLDRGDLLVEDAPDRITFADPELQAYLAARELVESDALAEVVRHAHEDRWRQVAVYAAGHARQWEATTLVGDLLDRADAESGGGPRAARLRLLAVRAHWEAAVRQPVRDRVTEAQARFIPPRSAEEGAALTAAGPWILELLPDPAGLDPADPTTALLRLAVGTIGGERAERYVRDIPDRPAPPPPDTARPRPLPDRPVASPLLVTSRPYEESGPESDGPRTVTLGGGEHARDLAPLAPTVRRAVCRGPVDLALLRALPLLHSVTVENHPGLDRLDDLTGLPRLRSLALFGCPRLDDLTALNGTGVMFLEISPAPRLSVLADLAPMPRLRALFLPTADVRYLELLEPRLPGVTLLPGTALSA